MEPRAYYNEIEPYCAHWLHNLMRANLIMSGDIDTRPIQDVTPNDLCGYTQHHFFAGLGGWSCALRLAAWPDHREVWTGSCPCQPFSAAGKRGGFADERHLWPYWQYLIEQRRPAVVLGEQVASAADWLRLVRGDLEALDYAVAAIPVEAASAGADHLRDRFWFVAHDDKRGLGGQSLRTKQPGRTETVGASEVAVYPGIVAYEQNERHQRGGSTRRWRNGFANSCRDFRGGYTDATVGVITDEPGSISRIARDTTGSVGQADAHGARLPERGSDPGFQRQAVGAFTGQAAERDGVGDMADSNIGGTNPRRSNIPEVLGFSQAQCQPEWSAVVFGRSGDGSQPEQGSDFQWVVGADSKARRVKSGVRLLVDGFPNRIPILRAFGNAIDPRCAAKVIESVMDFLPQ